LSTTRGFTLIELLVALAIFGVIAVLSIRAISAALDQRAHIEDEARKWRELGRLYAALESDLGAALSGAGTRFIGLALPDASDGGWLAFARAGRASEGEAPVAPRGIRYRLIDGHIERTTDHGAGMEEAFPPLGLSRYPSRVLAVAMRYLSARGEWLAQWSEADGLPRAVEIDLELASRERVRRVLLVR